jgi:hypothetical protein
MLPALLQAATPAAESLSGGAWGLAATIVTLTLTVTVGIIKILQQRQQLQAQGAEMSGLETTKRVALVVMGALDKAKPALGDDKAKLMTGAIAASAKDAGVLGELDALLKANGLNP